MKDTAWDTVIIGCGIAGASLAFFLTRKGMGKILLLEKEEQPGTHATGRSAATAVEYDPLPSLLGLKVQGTRFLRRPPLGFSENRLLHPTGILLLFDGDPKASLLPTAQAMSGLGVDVRILNQGEACALVPALSQDAMDGALLLPGDGRLDVHELLWSYLRHARKGGATLHTREEVTGISVAHGRVTGVWTDQGAYRCRWVVNAAGAWAERIRALIGPSPIAFTPYRRTIVTFAPPGEVSCSNWPFVAHPGREVYFAPEPGGLLASPMDMDPQEPCDIRPDAWGEALAMDHLQRVAPALVPRSLLHRWAGLRTFAPDQCLVVGEDPLVKGFFWLAGQGGAGIETSPAVGEMAADLLVHGKTTLEGVEDLSPLRFMV